MTGIICALDIEAEKLIANMENAECENIGRISFTYGRLMGHDVIIGLCGMGKVNAAMCAQTMILRYAPSLIVNSGVAGSLSPRLSIGDIAVGTGVVEHDFDVTALGLSPGFFPELNGNTFPCDAEVVKAILRAAEREHVRALPARIASGDQFVSDAPVKDRIVRTFDAQACDMEAGAIAHVCYGNAVKCAVIRAISDSTDGEHHMEFQTFLPMAAENSARVLIAFLECME